MGDLLVLEVTQTRREILMYSIKEASKLIARSYRALLTIT